jgi:hypothetical protein
MEEDEDSTPSSFPHSSPTPRMALLYLPPFGDGHRNLECRDGKGIPSSAQKRGSNGMGLSSAKEMKERFVET